MKKHITALFKTGALFMVFLSLAIVTFAGTEDPTIEKKKTFSKIYPLNCESKGVN